MDAFISHEILSRSTDPTVSWIAHAARHEALDGGRFRARPVGASLPDRSSFPTNGNSPQMTAEIIQIRDYQNKRDIQRLYEEVTAELMAIAGPVEIENVELVNTESLVNNYPFPPWP